MWIIVLPMFILLAITPMLLLSEDLLTESQQQSAAQIARMVQIQHRAVVDYCGDNPATCNQQIPYALFKGYLDENNRAGELFKTDAGIVSVAANSGQVVTTVLSNERAISQMRLPPTNMIQQYWAEQNIAGAGLYNAQTGNVMDSNGNQFPVSLSATDDHAPVLVCNKNGSHVSAC